MSSVAHHGVLSGSISAASYTGIGRPRPGGPETTCPETWVGPCCPAGPGGTEAMICVPDATGGELGAGVPPAPYGVMPTDG